MKKLIVATALLLGATLLSVQGALAQCSGIFTSGQLCANAGAGSALGVAVAPSTWLDRVFGSTRGSLIERGASGWAAITPGTIGLPLVSAGAGADPLYQVLGVAGGGSGITSGTSGGIPYFSSATTIASSAALAVNAFVVGGGAGAAPSSVAITGLVYGHGTSAPAAYNSEVIPVAVVIGAGNSFSWNGRSQIASSADGLIALVNTANTDFSRLQFGGTTSSFPSLKRNTTALNVRLADDSADANLTAAAGTFSATVTATNHIAGAGNTFSWSGRSQIASSADGLITLLDAAATSFSRLLFGGTTSSFPAIKRSAAALEVRLADDSGSANLTVAGLSASTVNNVTITAPASAATLTIANTKTATINNSITLAGTDGTTWTGASVSMTLAALNIEDQTLAGGANVTSKSLSTGNITVDCGARPIQHITNGGAFTITAPANDGSCLLLVTNNATAGAITFSGFSVGTNTGDSLTTTNGNKFIIQIARINSSATYGIKALQ